MPASTRSRLESGERPSCASSSRIHQLSALCTRDTSCSGSCPFLSSLSSCQSSWAASRGAWLCSLRWGLGTFRRADPFSPDRSWESWSVELENEFEYRHRIYMRVRISQNQLEHDGDQNTRVEGT